MPIEWSDLAVFVIASLTLNLTPGNDMMFVLGQSLKGGVRTGIAASLGIATGSLIHLALVAAGLAVVLADHPALFTAIRYAGAGCLLWIAWKTLHQTPAAGILAQPRSAFAAWRDGALVNILNPKIIVFMFAFLPPFIRPENGDPLLQLAVLGMIFNLGGTLINFAVATFAARAARVISGDGRAALWFTRASASIFTLLALRVAAGTE